MARVLILAANVGMAVGGYGGAERSIKLAESMPEHDVTILMSSMNGEDRSKVINPKLRMIHVVEDRNLGTQILQYAKREFEGNMDITMYALFNKLNRFRAELTKQLTKTDLVILDHVGAIGLVRNVEINVPVIYASHNCESDLADQMYAKYPTNKKNIFDMEKLIIEKADAITYCSKDDIEKMNKLYSIDVPAYYIPNGTDQQPILNRNNNTSKDLIFIGSGHGPNVEAARSLINTAKLIPEYRFNIIGKCGDSLKNEVLPDNFIVHGHLSDQLMNLLFENAFAFLNPMTAGSGTHLKIMRALSYGLPIISSTTGLRGFSDEEIKDTLLVANNNDEIIKAINLLKDEKVYKDVSSRTQKLSEPYLWPVIQQDFDTVVNSLIGGTVQTVQDDVPTKPKENVLIYSIIRNNADTMDRYYDQIKATAMSIPGYNFYLSVYENDSTDETRNKLISKDWSFLSGISITSENINTTHFGSVKSAERVENLAHARNKALEGGGFLDKVDYVLMTEGDNSYTPEDVRQLLTFGDKEDFDVVSALSLRENGTHYDWWATRTTYSYKQGASEVPRNFKNLSHDKYYSTSNGLCLYKAKPFQEGARYGWINMETGKFDCEMVVICQEFRKRGYKNVFVNYKSLSRH